MHKSNYQKKYQIFLFGLFSFNSLWNWFAKIIKYTWESNIQLDPQQILLTVNLMKKTIKHFLNKVRQNFYLKNLLLMRYVEKYSRLSNLKCLKGP
ncbi:hypothetical protein BpHYR1_009038 [Brachionus plicatilis]|uniref:Uncharacterized protein n=1 Tax=Brachionus plicatilis TaxID=10195 RepID=A0A3M7PXI9_BRAPC|nr:hypothetical protein BpHYR1_009038 [Brachionus plicatilis]